MTMSVIITAKPVAKPSSAALPPVVTDFSNALYCASNRHSCSRGNASTFCVVVCRSSAHTLLLSSQLYNADSIFVLHNRNNKIKSRAYIFRKLATAHTQTSLTGGWMVNVRLPATTTSCFTVSRIVASDSVTCTDRIVPTSNADCDTRANFVNLSKINFFKKRYI